LEGNIIFYTLDFILKIFPHDKFEGFGDISIIFPIVYRSLNLPNSENHETGSQICRYSQSIKDNIAEGYGRRKYKNDFVKFLIYSNASLLESKSQSEFLDTMQPNTDWNEICKRLDELEIRLNHFITFVEKKWKTT